MKIDYYSSTEEILLEIGRRTKAARIAMSETQQDLAERANLSVKTISNLETGKDVSFSTIIEVLRMLGQLPALDLLIPDQSLRPSRIAAFEKPRERARRKTDVLRETGAVWKWGDEQ